MAEPTDSVLLPQFVMKQAVDAGLAAGWIVRESGLPQWAMVGDTARIPSHGYLRTWEVVEHGLGIADAAVRIAECYVVGELGLYDYLFSTAPTLGAGLAVCGPFIGAISTNFRFEPGPETMQEISFRVAMIDGEGRGRELAMQFALAAIFTRTRLVTAERVDPVRVTFRQSAPRNHASLVEVFGTDAIDFDAPQDGVTFRAADLDLPLRTADARLAAILHRCAQELPALPPRATTCADRLAAVLASALEAGPVTLELVARTLAMSPRTLQRRLAEEDTTWRAQLDRARRLRHEKVCATRQLTQPEKASLLGYGDPRSARRLLKRWRADEAMESCAAESGGTDPDALAC
ncbi:AraC family transcriptional regulator ligand-binding domain-containing protein [Nocardia sp. NPDC020380]|uniref:AraC family transcriptional regulator n=1 Tax=Nocardia sp. NPDC020380 TaxID=3364309 RepID=UPI00378CE26C